LRDQGFTEQCTAVLVALLKALPIQNCDTACTVEGNHASLPEFCQGAAHGLCRKRKAIGNVIARNRQHDRVSRARNALSDIEEEGADLFPRRDAAEN
jgi:hypothetical protein